MANNLKLRIQNGTKVLSGDFIPVGSNEDFNDWTDGTPVGWTPINIDNSDAVSQLDNIDFDTDVDGDGDDIIPLFGGQINLPEAWTTKLNGLVNNGLDSSGNPIESTTAFLPALKFDVADSVGTITREKADYFTYANNDSDGQYTFGSWFVKNYIPNRNDLKTGVQHRVSHTMVQLCAKNQDIKAFQQWGQFTDYDTSRNTQFIAKSVFQKDSIGGFALISINLNQALVSTNWRDGDVLVITTNTIDEDAEYDKTYKREALVEVNLTERKIDSQDVLIHKKLYVNSNDLTITIRSLDGQLTNSRIEIKDIVFHSGEDSYVDVETLGGVTIYHDNTRTAHAPPEISQHLKEYSIGKTINLAVDVVLSTMNTVYDNVIVDFGGVNSYLITATGAHTFSMIADGQFVRVRLSGKDGANGTIAHFSEISVSVSSTTTNSITQVGDPTVSPFTSEVRIHNSAENSKRVDYGIATSLDFKVGETYKIDLDVNSISANTEIKVLINRVEQSTITSSGVSTINYTPTEKVSSLQLRVASTNNGSTDVSLNSMKTFLNKLKISNVYSELDFYEDTVINSTFAVKDAEYLSTNNGDYSKTINIPASVNNLKAFSGLHEITQKDNLGIRNGVPFILTEDGQNILTGKAFLVGVKYAMDSAEYLEIELKGGNNDWSEVIKNKELSDLSMGVESISTDSIIVSNSLGSLSNVCYPLLDLGEWGINDGAYTLTPEHIRPAYKISKVFDSIFNESGYSIKSNFFEDNNDFDNDFSPEFHNNWKKFIGVNGNPKRSQKSITESVLMVSTTTDAQSLNNYNGVLPKLIDSMDYSGQFGNMYWGDIDLELDNPLLSATGHYLALIEHAVVNFETTHIDGLNQVSSSSTPFGFLENDYSGDFSYPNNGTMFNVELSGVYDIDLTMKLDIIRGAQGNFFTGYVYAFLVKQGTSLNEFFSIFRQSSYKTVHAGEGNGLKEFAISQNQYLTAGANYQLYVFQQDINEGSVYGFNHSFILKSCDLSMKLSENIMPDNVMYESWNDMIPEYKVADILPFKTQLEFISEVSKIFNLTWQTNPITKVIEVEPYNDFYDWSGDKFDYLDWNDKGYIDSFKSDSILKGALSYTFNSDSSDGSLSYYSLSDDIQFGDKKVITGVYSKDDHKHELRIYSSAKMGEDRFISNINNPNSDSGSAIRLMKIHSGSEFKTYYSSNGDKPAVVKSFGHKLAIFDSVRETPQGTDIRYSLKKVWSSSSNEWVMENRVEGAYAYAYTYTDVDSTKPVLTFSEQTVTDADNAPATVGGLYNTYHQKRVEMLKFSDRIAIALVNLSYNDIHELNFRRLVKLDGALYMINKIKDYTPNSDEPTEVELILVTPRGNKEKI
tara:strand:+ start:15026 stop:19102 length:4077 start_codon:yes stop_codon:yes gene_type:complete